MRYYRCRCGKHTAWSSMGVADCDGCAECNTTLAESPNGHSAIAPHDFREEFTVDAKTGARQKERVCLRCQHREPVVFTVYFNDAPVLIRAVDLTAGQLKAMGNVDPFDRLTRDDEARTELPAANRVEIYDGMRLRVEPANG